MANRIVLNETSYHGAGAIQEIANEAKARGFKKAFVCSDPDLIKFNVTCKVTKVLEDAGLAYEIYSNIKPNPTIENVQTGVAAFKASGADYIIAIGGGSSMDTSKGNRRYHHQPLSLRMEKSGGRCPDQESECADYRGSHHSRHRGGGYHQLRDHGRGEKRKFVCVDTHDIPVVAVVDPEMMSSMPKGLTAATGMDALTHAIEGYTTKGAWEMTDMFNLKAIEVIARSLRDARGQPPEGSEGMALGQYLTGMGFSNCGLGIVHSMAHALGALCDTPTALPTPSSFPP